MLKTRNLCTFAALAALALMAAHPFIQGRLPWSADGLLHLYRLVSLDHALADGTLWPRYVAGMVYGYGAPMFNYYAPLSLYPLQALHLAGLSFLHAWLAGMAFYLLLAATGAFLLGRQWGGALAGFVTAAAYLYAPYTLYDAVARGTVAELASLAGLPWVLWALARLAQHGHPRDFALTALSFALFIPLHNVITLHSAALIGGYTLLLIGLHGDRLHVLLRLGLGLGVGGLLAAFFWMPAILETRYIKLEAITANLPFIDVTANLTPLASVFALPIPADPTQMQPPTPISLGWPQLILSGLALILALHARRHRMLIAFALGFSALMAFMNTEASAVLWRTVPLIRYSQYPWRLLGLASLLLALSAGLGAALLIERIRPASARSAVFILTLVSLALYGVPWLYAPSLPVDETNPQNITDAQAFERSSGLIGTSSFGEYLPIWNFELPDTERLAPRFASAPVIARLIPPTGVSITAARWWHTRADLALTSSADQTLVFDWFYFPGWWATLDGQPIEVYPSEPEGLLSLKLPAGEHRLAIALGLTDLQRNAGLLSMAGIAGLFVVLVWRRAPFWGARPDRLIQTAAPDIQRLALLVMVTGVVLFVVKVLVIDQINSPLRREQFADVLAEPLTANFGDKIGLIAHDLSSTTIRADEPAQLHLYWRLLAERLMTDYTTVITVRDPAGSTTAQVESWQPGGLSTRNWRSGYYLQERVIIDLPPGTPPGNYTIEVSLYDPARRRSLDVLNADGSPVDVSMRLARLTITRPERPSTLTPEIALRRTVNGLELVGMDVLPEMAGVGQALDVALYWALDGSVDPDLTMRLIWQQDEKTAAATPTIAPVTYFPLAAWQTGDRWVGRHRLYVPGALETGSYTLAVEIAGAAAPLGTMRVEAPERRFDLPDAAITMTDSVWANGLRLRGYSVSDETLTLYWQADQPMNDDLRVFVHRLADDGRIAEQAGGIPADWTRPTTGWAAGEVITERYSFASVDGETFRIGWYSAADNVRVLLTDGQDHTLLTP